MDSQMRPNKEEIKQAIAALRRRRKTMWISACAMFCVVVGTAFVLVNAFRTPAAPPAAGSPPTIVQAGGKITFLKSQGKNDEEGDILMLMEGADGKIEILRGILMTNGDAVTITVPDGSVSVNKEPVTTPAP